MALSLSTRSPVWIQYKSATLLLRQGKPAEAIELYEQVIKLEPSYLKAYANLGVALKQVGRLGEAIIVFERLRELRPRQATVYNNLGNVYTTIGDFSEAVNCYRRAIALRPTYQAAYLNLGNVLYFTGKIDEAIETRIQLAKITSAKRGTPTLLKSSLREH